jgi:hypothetical protein
VSINIERRITMSFLMSDEAWAEQIAAMSNNKCTYVNLTKPEDTSGVESAKVANYYARMDEAEAKDEGII